MTPPDGFNFELPPPRPAGRGLIVDSFAGGGGASLGLERALGRPVDIAINHDETALAMHAANHPETLHLSKNIWHVDPIEAVGTRPVDVAWFSPDCKHFSKAKGGRPVKRNIRDLAWVVVHWAQRVRPKVIFLENVEEFQHWGPVDLDGRPCPERKGAEFKRWIAALKRLGYRVDWRELTAWHYGAPTIRKRLFLVARCDGAPIVWPERTHGDPNDPDDAARIAAGELEPWRTAAECIDWSIRCPSIFARKKPLAENTLKRIARGVVRYVLQAERPFLVPVTHAGDARSWDSAEPLRTITTAQRGEAALIAPHVTKFYSGSTGQAADGPLATITANSFHKKPGGAVPLGVVAAHLSRQFGQGTGQAPDTPSATITPGGQGKSALVAGSLVQTGYGERTGQAPRSLDVETPLGTVVAGGAKHAAVAAFLAQHNTGVTGHDAREPVSTIVGKGCTQALVGAHMLNLKGADRRDGVADKPGWTICADGEHVAAVYGTGGQHARADDPMHTLTAQARMGLVTVTIDGTEYALADIGMRMLTPRELFRAQGFPDGYAIDRDADGNPFTKTAQIRCCGNSVCPPVAEALVRANVGAGVPA